MITVENTVQHNFKMKLYKKKTFPLVKPRISYENRFSTS